MRRTLIPLLIFIAGALVGPLLYWVMPASAWFYYGLGPLLWPVQILGPVIDWLGITDSTVLVGFNVLLYTVVGIGLVAVAHKPPTLLFAGGLLEIGIAILALWPVLFGSRNLFGDNGTSLMVLLIAQAFYGLLVFLVYITVKRLQRMPVE